MNVPFDPAATPGEVRIFADAPRPFVALVVEEHGLLGRTVVPVSPHPAPVSGRELALGERVYQLWNACLLSRRFTDRSWLVDTLSEADLAAVRAALPAACPGRIVAGDGPQARYEREHLVSARTLVAPSAPKVRPGVFARLWPEVVKLAASFVVCVGAFYVIMGEGLGRLTAWRESYRLCIGSEEEPIELAEMDLPAEAPPKVFETLSEEMPLPVSGPSLREPSVAWYGAAHEAARTANPATLGTASAALLAPVRLAHPAGTVDPHAMPLSVLELGALSSLASVAGPVAPSAAADALAPQLACRVVESPWNPLAVVLNITAGPSDAGLAEVFFDKSLVRGYRLIAGGGSHPLNAYYEVLLHPAGVEDPTRIVQVTVRWRTGAGESRRLVPIVVADLSDFRDMPANPHAGETVPTFVAPDDVPVESGL